MVFKIHAFIHIKLYITKSSKVSCFERQNCSTKRLFNLPEFRYFLKKHDICTLKIHGCEALQK